MIIQACDFVFQWFLSWYTHQNCLVWGCVFKVPLTLAPGQMQGWDSEDGVWTRPCLHAPSASTAPAFQPCGSLDNLQAFLLLLYFFIPFIHLEVADKIRQASFYMHS